MAVNTNDIKNSLLAMFEDMASTSLDGDEARDYIAGEWAEIIKTAILSADVVSVKTDVSTIVATTGSPVAQSGTGTGSGTQTGTGSLE